MNSIGDLFRDYGEVYIQKHNPSPCDIKLIRSIQLCRTPALGATVYTCKICGQKHFIYKSCGSSRCMICQSIKREQWVDKLKSKLLAVPYIHSVFTLPHELNGLCRRNQSIMYSLVMKVSWLTVRQIGKSQGFAPGMTSVLHTFGSDLKYHIHVHSLVSYGGLTNELEWKYPQTKNKLEKYRKICTIYRNIFLKELEKVKPQLSYPKDIDSVLSEIKNTRWVVHSTYPSMDTRVIEIYLARYINRIAISPGRLNYLKNVNEVHIQYNDYKNQQTLQAAPKLIKVLHPIDAIQQILQHNIPVYFQKSRSYGLHNKCNLIQQQIPISIKRNGQTVRTIIEIITQLLKLENLKCIKCGNTEFYISDFKPIKYFYNNKLLGVSISSPPSINTTYYPNNGNVNYIYSNTAMLHNQKKYNIRI